MGIVSSPRCARHSSTHSTQPAAAPHANTEHGLPASESGLLHGVPRRKTVHLADLLARADVAQAKGHTKAGRGRWRARRTSPGCSARRLESISTRGAIAARRAKCAPVVQRDLQRVHQHSASKWLASEPVLRQVTKLDETLLDQLTHRAAGPCEPACSGRVGRCSFTKSACSSEGSVSTGSMASASSEHARPRRAPETWDLGGRAGLEILVLGSGMVDRPTRITRWWGGWGVAAH